MWEKWNKRCNKSCRHPLTKVMAIPARMLYIPSQPMCQSCCRISSFYFLQCRVFPCQMVPLGCWVRSFEGAWIENNSCVFDLPQSVHFPALYISSIILSLHRKIHLKSRPGFPQDYKDHWFQNTRGFMSGLFYRQFHGAVVFSWVQFVKI